MANTRFSAATDEVSDRRPEVTRAMDDLDGIVVALADQVEKLERRLEPVMHNLEPSPCGVQANDPSSHRVWDLIDIRRRKLEMLRDCIATILDRLEV